VKKWIIKILKLMIGILPYITISIIVNQLWAISFGSPLSFSWYRLGTLLIVPCRPHSIIFCISFLGGWALWYLLCKCIKFIIFKCIAYLG